MRAVKGLLTTFLLIQGMTAAAPTLAASIVFQFSGQADPPSAPFAVTSLGPSFELPVGGTTLQAVGVLALDLNNNASGSADFVYHEFVVNGVQYIVGDPMSATGPSQRVNYSVQPVGDCFLEVMASQPTVLDVGTSLGTPAAFLTVTFEAAMPLPQSCGTFPAEVPIFASFTLELQSIDEDSDDDGITDDNELAGTSCPASGPTDPLIADTDGDGLLDGLECGLATPESPDTDLSVFVADTDTTTMTDAVDDDTDDDGLLDGTEDGNRNGAVDAGETDPNDIDSDNDGLQDGTESGLIAPEGSGTDAGVFVADADPSTVTNPTNDDTDGDGLLDGDEDANRNGAVDPGETDPLVPDMPPPPPSESCIEAADRVIAAARDYQKASREMKRKCGMQSRPDCPAVYDAQQLTFVELSEAQVIAGIACLP